jgi:DNA-binding MarR family transcriptional regulator
MSGLTVKTDSTNMDPSSLEIIENKIIRSLGEKPSSSIVEIARELNVNRSTASKYLHVLKAKRLVRFRQVGPVKLWSLER